MVFVHFLKTKKKKKLYALQVCPGSALIACSLHLPQQCPKPVVVAVHGACIGGGECMQNAVGTVMSYVCMNKLLFHCSLYVKVKTPFVYVLPGVDLITACDIRLCTQDAWFQVKVGVHGLV